MFVAYYVGVEKEKTNRYCLRMEIESQIFAKSIPNPEALIQYGFAEKEEGYRYQEIFADGEFKADILVQRDGTVKGRVLEIAMGEEEFAPLRIDSYGGGYVGGVREEYRSLLKRIKDACFSHSLFHSEQANRIAEALLSRYGESPDFPWNDENGVFRYPGNNKWYGLIMNIPKKKLTHVEEDEKPIDVMNLKVNDGSLESVLSRPGVFPAYHMNHQKWISVALDDTLCDDEVLSLIESSRESILPKKATPKK